MQLPMPSLPSLAGVNYTRTFGKVTGVSGLIIAAEGVGEAAMGSRCHIRDASGHVREAEVVGFKEQHTLLMPFAPMEGIGPGAKVFMQAHRPVLQANNSLIGRVVNALGEPIDGKGPLASGGEDRLLKAQPPRAAERQPVGPKLDTGVRVLNTFLPICEGQRMGIFSGSGVGKSVLMAMVARYTEAEVNVIGLVGERGREVREFVEDQLGEQGLRKSVVVVATGDEPPLMRRQAAYTTMAIAEYFRDCGFRVMLFMDSVTRFAMAQREIGLSAGEPPTTRGYTPSVFSELPRLLERAGPGTGKGNISAIFTVLVEGGDFDEPVSDAVRGIIDGHIILTREMAERGHFPAVDVLKSISRMVPLCLTKQENAVVNRARQLLATYTNMEELIRLGAYQKGSDALVDEAITYYTPLSAFLKQAPDEHTTITDAFGKLASILGMSL